MKKVFWKTVKRKLLRGLVLYAAAHDNNCHQQKRAPAIIVNGVHLFSASKCLILAYTHTHSFIQRWRRSSHARLWPAHWEQFGGDSVSCSRTLQHAVRSRKLGNRPMIAGRPALLPELLLSPQTQAPNWLKRRTVWLQDECCKNFILYWKTTFFSCIFSRHCGYSQTAEKHSWCKLTRGALLQGWTLRS